MSELTNIKELIHDILGDLSDKPHEYTLGEIYDGMVMEICDAGECGNMDCMYCPLHEEEDFRKYMEELGYE